VTYSISIPPSAQPYLSIAPVSGTLNAGQEQVITVTASATAGLEYVVTVDPGGYMVLIYNTPIS
jgi:hypothetical protein